MDTNATGSEFETELLEHVGRVLADPSELEAFWHWFTRALWEADTAESSASEDILSFAYLIELFEGTVDAGMWTDRDFLEALREETEKKYGEIPSPANNFHPIPLARSRASA